MVLPLNDEAFVVIPQDDRIMAVVEKLCGMQFPTFIHRALASALVRGYRNGSVSAGEVWQLLLKLHHISAAVESSDDGEWLDPVREEQQKIWTALDALLVSLVSPLTPLDLEADELFGTSRLPWASDVLAQLEHACSGQGDLSHVEIADQLPGDVIAEVRSRLGRVWFGSYFAMGAQLADPPVYAADRHPEAIADLLARAVADGIHDYHQAPDKMAGAPALFRMDVAWILLKGFVYGLVHSPQHTQSLAPYPEIAGRVKQALTDGLAFSNDHSAELGNPWMSGDEATAAIVATSTPELLASLQNYIDRPPSRVFL